MMMFFTDLRSLLYRGPGSLQSEVLADPRYAGTELDAGGE